MPRSRTPAGEPDTPGALPAPPARQPRGTAAGPGRTAPRVRVEFIVEPFVEGRLGPHVRAAVGSLRREGLEPDVGPFGTALEGEAAPVLDAVARAAAASFGAGASGFTLHAIAEAEPEPAEEDEEGLDAFLAALDPVARAIGGSIVAPGARRAKA